MFLASYSPFVSAATYLNLDFAIDRQTYNWADSVSVSQRVGNRTLVQLHNRSFATLFQESVFGQGGDRWQKSAQSRGTIDYRFSNRISAGLSVSQEFDRLEERRFVGTKVLLTSAWDRSSWNWRQGGGILWENRRFEPTSNNQTGYIYQSQLNLNPLSSTKYGSGRIEGEITSLRSTPRKSITISYDLPGLIIKSDTLSLAASQSFTQRKYFPSSDNFESQAEQNSEQRRWDVAVSKALPLSSRLHFNAGYRYDRYDYEYGNMASEFLRQNDNLTSIFEYELNLERRLYRHVALNLSYLFNRTDEDFGSSQTNQLAETGRLSLRATYDYRTTDSIELAGQIGVTSYFAPTSSVYFSDRDRSIKIASLRTVRKFSDYLTVSLDGSYRGFHIIYISGELSANNNINNVYIVNPSLHWRPVDGVHFRQNYQMHANYIYYQYEKNAVSERNTLYRRANLINTLNITLSARTELILEYSYRFEDFGRLIWEDQWKQQVSWDRRTHRPRLGIEYRPVKGLYFYPYASYEIQSSYDHLFAEENILGERIKSDELKRRLIGFEFRWNLSLNSLIECKLERRVQEYREQRNQDYDVFTITVKKFL